MDIGEVPVAAKDKASYSGAHTAGAGSMKDLVASSPLTFQSYDGSSLLCSWSVRSTKPIRTHVNLNPQDLVQHLESIVIHWTRQIKDVVNNHDNALSAEILGPLEEIEVLCRSPHLFILPIDPFLSKNASTNTTCGPSFSLSTTCYCWGAGLFGGGNVWSISSKSLMPTVNTVPMLLDKANRAINLHASCFRYCILACTSSLCVVMHSHLLQFWRCRTVDLSGISEQLLRPDVQARGSDR